MMEDWNDGIKQFEGYFYLKKVPTESGQNFKSPLKGGIPPLAGLPLWQREVGRDFIEMFSNR
jgi:hypothetical protein